MVRSVALAVLVPVAALGFRPSLLLLPAVPSSPVLRRSTTLYSENNNRRKADSSGFPNPLRELQDMFSSMDDVVEDFMCKRMGNGETFYGKRKYKPSGRPHTGGKYNGMGLSDRLRIDITRQVKEEIMEKRRQQREEEEKS